MSGDASAFGFGKFIPGFDFLQGLAQSAGAAANPLGRVPQWVAPTVSVEEVDKRIAELKAVRRRLGASGALVVGVIECNGVRRRVGRGASVVTLNAESTASDFNFIGVDDDDEVFARPAMQREFARPAVIREWRRA